MAGVEDKVYRVSVVQDGRSFVVPPEGEEALTLVEAIDEAQSRRGMGMGVTYARIVRDPSVAEHVSPVGLQDMAVVVG